MPGLKDLLKKKDKLAEGTSAVQSEPTRLPVPEFTFLRTTTETEEVIQPPTYPDDDQTRPDTTGKDKRRTLGWTSNPQPPTRPRDERRLSQRLHLSRRDRAQSAESSSNLPKDLPDAPQAAIAARPTSTIAANVDDAEAQAARDREEQREAQWEKRATILAMNSPFRDEQVRPEAQQAAPGGAGRSRSPSISDKTSDVNIQEAIRLHEQGDLIRSTEMFGQLADPKGANNALSQVLYGLALRHAWGLPAAEPEKAVHYLSLAASNSASVEEQALQSGLKKGGSAKGELVLAIFELANCFRYG